MIDIKIAWRNLWRSPLRSSVIIIAIALGLWGAVFMSAFFSGMVQQRINSAISIETANLQINNPEYLLNPSIENGMSDLSSISRHIADIPEVKCFYSDLSEQGLISNASMSSGVTIHGIEPERQQETTQLSTKIKDGEFLNNQMQIPIVIGDKMAKKLNAAIGDKVVLSLADMNGEVTYGAFLIKGIYKTHNDQFDESNVYVLKKELATLLKTPKNYATGITIATQNNKLTNRAKTKLETLLKKEIDSEKIKIQSWKEIDPTLEMMIQSMDYFGWIFIGIVLIALVFGIVNTMLMVIVERTRELGMMMAIGMNRSRIFIMILWETILLSFVGAISGIILAVITISITQKTGIDLSMVSSGMNAYGYDSLIYPFAKPEFYFEVAGLVLLMSVIASIFPTRHALKLSPADAIRN